MSHPGYLRLGWTNNCTYFFSYFYDTFLYFRILFVLMTIEFLWDKNSSRLMGLYRKQKTLKNSDYFSYLFSKIMTFLFIFLINKYSNPPSNAVVRGFCYEFKHLSFFLLLMFTIHVVDNCIVHETPQKWSQISFDFI